MSLFDKLRRGARLMAGCTLAIGTDRVILPVSRTLNDANSGCFSMFR